MPNTLGLVYAFGYSILWGATNIVLRRLTERLSPTLVIGLRASVGVVVILPLGLLVAPQDVALLTPQRVAYLAGSVLIGGVFGSIFNVYALKLIGVIRSQPLSNASPLFAILFSYLLLGEPIRWRMLPGTLLVLAGVYLVSVPGKGLTTDGARSIQGRDLAAGLGFALAAATLWGINGVVLSLGLQGINTVVANSVRVPVVAVVSLAMSGLRGECRQLRKIDRPMLGLILLAGTFGYALLSTLYVSAVQVLGPSLTQIIGITSPLFALPLGILVLKERPTRLAGLGTLLTVAGIGVVLA
jgi:drug/metabolite transporter (DMT)-like permease